MCIFDRCLNVVNVDMFAQYIVTTWSKQQQHVTSMKTVYDAIDHVIFTKRDWIKHVAPKCMKSSLKETTSLSKASPPPNPCDRQSDIGCFIEWQS